MFLIFWNIQILNEAYDTIDEVSDSIREVGIVMVVATQKSLAVKECNVTSFPALVVFRNGNPIKYPGTLEDGTAAQVIILSNFWNLLNFELNNLIN